MVAALSVRAAGKVLGGEKVGRSVWAAEREVLAVLEGEAPFVSEAVGEDDTVEVAESVVLGERVAVPVTEGVGEGVLALEREVLPVLEGAAPRASEAVGEGDTVELAESVALSEGD